MNGIIDKVYAIEVNDENAREWRTCLEFATAQGIPSEKNWKSFIPMVAWLWITAWPFICLAAHLHQDVPTLLWNALQMTMTIWVRNIGHIETELLYRWYAGPQCNSNKAFCISAQERSADEEQTTRATCLRFEKIGLYKQATLNVKWDIFRFPIIKNKHESTVSI
jgi:hypothetical protein